MLSLQRQPYARYVEILDELREPGADRSSVAFEVTRSEGRGIYDLNELERCRLARILQVRGEARDVELIRFLLDQEIQARRNDSLQGDGETLTLLSALLVRYGDANDTIRFWKAKKANFDTWAGGYDIEFVFAFLPPHAVFEHIVKIAGKGALDGYAMTSMTKREPSERAVTVIRPLSPSLACAASMASAAFLTTLPTAWPINL